VWHGSAPFVLGLELALRIVRCEGIFKMLRVRDNLPLALMGVAFVTLAAATQCTSTTGDPATNGEIEAGHLGTDDSGTPLGCSKDTDCPLPPSTCDGPGTLVYYTDSRCVEHQCHWQSQTQQCPNCSSGGCLGTTTSAGIGNFMMPDSQVGAGGALDAAADHPVIAFPDAGPCADDDASTCAVPSSVCVDNEWMAFFTNGSCHQNRCEWQVQYRDCGALRCLEGGCLLNVTTK
jgi:hypothetical protein